MDCTFHHARHGRPGEPPGGVGGAPRGAAPGAGQVGGAAARGCARIGATVSAFQRLAGLGSAGQAEGRRGESGSRWFQVCVASPSSAPLSLRHPFPGWRPGGARRSAQVCWRRSHSLAFPYKTKGTFLLKRFACCATSKQYCALEGGEKERSQGKRLIFGGEGEKKIVNRKAGEGFS